MASAIIHIAVANELNKELKRDKAKFLIGSIAPDIAKIVGDSREKSHFIDIQGSDIPNIDLFLSKYKNYLSDDFVLGYYVHLYTDYLWFKYFIPELLDDDMIKKLDGTSVKCTDRAYSKYFYHDYTNLNIDVIEQYNLDLDIFYNKIPEMNSIIEEIPMKRLDELIDKMGLIIENSKKEKLYVINMDNVNTFIHTAIDLVRADLYKVFENIN